jgi:hypothetical protein
MYSSILAVIIGLGIIAYLMGNVNPLIKESMIKNSLENLRGGANSVCGSTTDTQKSVNVDFPYGIALYSGDVRICVNYTDKAWCGRIGCPIEQYLLDLNQTKFDVHEYRCSFTGGQASIRMECLG